MKLRLAGTVNRLNVEHRTSNIERPILMTLRFIDFKTSEPQPAMSSAESKTDNRGQMTDENRREGQPSVAARSQQQEAGCPAIFSILNIEYRTRNFE
jgi:hypothetical protein